MIDHGMIEGYPKQGHFFLYPVISRGKAPSRGVFYTFVINKKKYF